MTFSLSDRQCPDCALEPDADGVLAHADTCPLGRGIDQIRDEDRMWFALRPSLTERRRAAHWSEVAQMRHLGMVPEGAEVHGEVVVMAVSPGVRIKYMDGLYCVLGAEEVAR